MKSKGEEMVIEHSQNNNDDNEHKDEYNEVSENNENLVQWLKYVASLLIKTAKKNDRTVGMELLLEILDTEAGDHCLTSNDVQIIINNVKSIGSDFEMGNFEIDEVSALYYDVVYTNGIYVGSGYDIYEEVLRFGTASQCPCQRKENGDIISVEKPYFPDDFGFAWECLGTFNEYVGRLLKNRAAKTGQPISEDLLNEVIYELESGNVSDSGKKYCFTEDEIYGLEDEQVAEILKIANNN